MKLKRYYGFEAIVFMNMHSTYNDNLIVGVRGLKRKSPTMVI